MRRRSLVALAGLVGLVAFCNPARASSDPVVKVEPACPEWQRPARLGEPFVAPTITIRYDASSPGARLKSSPNVSVILASATFRNYEISTIPMQRSDGGTWLATYKPQKNNAAAYAIFFFRDGTGRVDNNRNQYWDVLYCERSEISPYAVEMQASTYRGGLLAPGFQRPPDLARAIQIVKTDLDAHPHAATHYSFLWNLQLLRGKNSPAAFDEIGKEVSAFLDTRATDLDTMRQTMSFVAVHQQQLPAHVIERFRSALIALPQTTDPYQINAVTQEIIRIQRTPRFMAGVQQKVDRGLAEFDYWRIDPNDSDQRRKAAAYLAFAEQHPQSTLAYAAYSQAFVAETALHDLPATEMVFAKWAAAKPSDPLALIQMAQVYVEQQIKPDRAIELLDAAEKLYQESERPSSHTHFHKDPGKLEWLRARAELLLQNWQAARADLQVAVRTAPDNPEFAYALGKTCERMGDNPGALEAYSAAASAPYQQNSGPSEAYERLFQAMRLGSKQDAEQKLSAQVLERIRRVTSDYTPFALDRPAPQFAFTNFAGERLDNETAEGKPTVLTFWGVWCPPCITELPAVEQFQEHHPGANVLAVEIGDKPDKIKAFLAGRRLSALNVAAQAEWPDQFGALAAPATIVMDRFGQVQFVHVGLLPDFQAVLSKDLSAFPDGS